MNGYYEQQTYSQGRVSQNQQKVSPDMGQSLERQSNRRFSSAQAMQKSVRTEEMNQEKYEDRQIIRKDAKNCFVESLWDSFSNGRAHFCFAAYDLTLAPGFRQTNKVNIYIAMPEIFRLCMNISNGILMSQCGDSKVTTIYEAMGGTSAKLLQRYGKPRPDGMSLSRVFKIMKGRNGFLMIASSGPGKEDEKGLIVPTFGKNPENHVVLPITWDGLCELLLMTWHAYQTWAIVNQQFKERG